jgi:ribosomal-protein-alanine N-acetyltransferase
VMEIAESSAQAPRWSRTAYAAALDAAGEPRRIALIAHRSNNAIAGFAISLIVGSEAELETIVVAPEWKRQGVGRALLLELAAALREHGVTKVLLEVRDSNRAARQLYRSNGFEESGRRPGYYTDPKEDAVLMERSL